MKKIIVYDNSNLVLLNLAKERYLDSDYTSAIRYINELYNNTKDIKYLYYIVAVYSKISMLPSHLFEVLIEIYISNESLTPELIYEIISVTNKYSSPFFALSTFKRDVAPVIKARKSSWFKHGTELDMISNYFVLTKIMDYYQTEIHKNPDSFNVNLFEEDSKVSWDTLANDIDSLIEDDEYIDLRSSLLLNETYAMHIPYFELFSENLFEIELRKSKKFNHIIDVIDSVFKLKLYTKNFLSNDDDMLEEYFEEEEDYYDEDSDESYSFEPPIESDGFWNEYKNGTLEAGFELSDNEDMMFNSLEEEVDYVARKKHASSNAIFVVLNSITLIPHLRNTLQLIKLNSDIKTLSLSIIEFLESNEIFLDENLFYEHISAEIAHLIIKKDEESLIKFLSKIGIVEHIQVLLLIELSLFFKLFNVADYLIQLMSFCDDENFISCLKFDYIFKLSELNKCFYTHSQCKHFIDLYRDIQNDNPVNASIATRLYSIIKAQEDSNLNKELYNILLMSVEDCNPEILLARAEIDVAERIFRKDSKYVKSYEELFPFSTKMKKLIIKSELNKIAEKKEGKLAHLLMNFLKDNKKSYNQIKHMVLSFLELADVDEIENIINIASKRIIEKDFISLLIEAYCRTIDQEWKRQIYYKHLLFQKKAVDTILLQNDTDTGVKFLLFSNRK